MSGSLSFLRSTFAPTKERALVTFSALALFAVYLFCVLCLDPSDDVLVFYGNWMDFESGKMIYRDFSFGNPPLSFVFIAIPGLLSTSLHGFYCVQAAEMMVMAWLSVVLVMKISGRLGLDRFRTTALYFIVLLIYSEEMVKKLDMAAALSVLLAVYLFLTRRYPSSYLVLLIGGMIKLYPFALVPVFIVASLLDRADPDRVKHALAGIGITIGMVMLALATIVVMGLDMSSFTKVLFEQSDRYFQMESVMGNLFNIFGLLGCFAYEIVESNYTYEIHCGPGDAVCDIWVFVTLAAATLLIFAIWHFRDANASRQDTDRRFVASVATMVLTILLTFSIFSTQYMLWIVTLIPFIIQAETDPRIRLRAQVIYLALFPMLVPLMMWLLFGTGEALAAFSVLIRNIALFFILAMGIRHVVGRPLLRRSASI